MRGSWIYTISQARSVRTPYAIVWFSTHILCAPPITNLARRRSSFVNVHTQSPLGAQANTILLYV